MVPLSVPVPTEHADRLRQSVDLAIRDLLAVGDNPLALAVYLWAIRRHRLALVNSDRLAAWGAGWARRVLVENVIGRRRDEEIAAAALVVVALAETPALVGVEDELRRGLGDLLTAELDWRLIPFGRPGYGALLLLGAAVAGVAEPRLPVAAAEIRGAFTAALAGSRLFGLGFAIDLAYRCSPPSTLAELERRVPEVLADPRTGYEDQLYLLHALWVRPAAGAARAERAALTEETLARSPAWSYLMNGLEDVPPAGDGRAMVPLSHLYRALLLDVVEGYRADVAAQPVAGQPYGVLRRLADWAALAFGVLLVLGLWAGMSWLGRPWLAAAGRYWIKHDFGALSPSAALLSLGVGALITLLIPLTLICLWTAWSFAVRATDRGDELLPVVLRRRVRRLAIWWASAVLAAVALELAMGILGPGLDYALSGQ